MQTAHLVAELDEINGTLAAAGVRIETIQANSRCASIAEPFWRAIADIEPRDLLEGLHSINALLAAEGIEITNVVDTRDVEIEQLRAERAVEYQPLYTELVEMIAAGEEPDEFEGQRVLNAMGKSMDDVAADVRELSVANSRLRLAREFSGLQLQSDFA